MQQIVTVPEIFGEKLLQQNRNYSLQTFNDWTEKWNFVSDGPMDTLVRVGSASLIWKNKKIS